MASKDNYKAIRNIIREEIIKILREDETATGTDLESSIHHLFRSRLSLTSSELQDELGLPWHDIKPVVRKLEQDKKIRSIDADEWISDYDPFADKLKSMF